MEDPKTEWGDIARKDLEAARQVLQRLDEARKKRPWRYYVPISPIETFHKSSAPIRVLAGPNRGGKTTAGAFELISIATGYHPIRKERFPTPNITWAISLDHQNLGSVMRRRLFSMLPPGYRYKVLENRVVLPKPWGSEIWFKSVDSEPEKFQGEGIVAAWFDEEPVGDRGHRVFREVYARRTPGIPLQIFMTFTPLQGLSWSYDYLWNKHSPKRLRGVETFSFTLYDCLKEKGGFLSAEEVETIEAGYDEYERQARVLGQYTHMGGKPFFSPRLVDSTMARCERYERFRISWTQDPIQPWKLVPSDVGELHVIRPYLSGHRYAIGVDPSGGVGHDYFVATVWDIDDLAECAYWVSNQLDPALVASRHLIPLGQLYGKAQLVVEVNGEHGPTVITELRGRYPNIYVNQKWDSIDRKPINEFGFRTHEKTRQPVLDVLTKLLREEKWIPSERLVREMRTFIRRNSDLKPEAQYGTHDDHIFAAGILLYVLGVSPPPTYKPWSYYQPKYQGQGIDSW